MCHALEVIHLFLFKFDSIYSLYCFLPLCTKMQPSGYGVELKIKGSGVQLSLLLMCRTVRHTSHSILPLPSYPAVMGTW